MSAKKFAHRAENTPKLVFWACWANFVAEMPLEGLRWAIIFAHTGTAAWYQRDVVPYMRERVGFLHYMKPSGCVSSACRSLM